MLLLNLTFKMIGQIINYCLLVYLVFIQFSMYSFSGYDFINRSTKAHASPVTVDVSPPEVTKESILVSGRILANISEIEAW